jgi:hypothetical protein
MSRLYVDLSPTAVARAAAHVEQVAATIAAAERVARHEFDLLGSGPFVPVDPERRSGDGYQPVDWYLDPVRGLRFPRGIPHTEWKLYEMRPGNADVKYPWELARCQHWVTLGQAFRLSGDERFAREVAHQLDDFVEANPVGVGIHWTCAMDVALRAVNWALGLALVRPSRELTPDFWTRAYSALFDHGVFVRDNLENTFEVTSNHFLSNLAGLWFLGIVFAETRSGREWKAFARDALEHEIDVQVLPDGADFESSVPYHRLVTELFLGCARLADRAGEPFSQHYLSRVRDMVSYLAAIIRPDGLMPQVGDADDGRLHVFGGYGQRTPQDPRHLFGPAAAFFNNPAWAGVGGDMGAWEATWWGLEPVTASLPAALPAGVAASGRLFPDAGVAVAAGGGAYLLMTNGCVGTKGFGNHKHNDQLSFEYHHGGVPLVVDPGSYVYTSDSEARNLFRSTAFHSTLQVDRVEQNEMNREWLFRLFECARAEHVGFEERAEYIQYAGRHHGYERLSDPVTHERTFTLSKADGALAIVDRLEGRGDHVLRWRFHLAPGVEAEIVDPSTIALTCGSSVWRLIHSPGLRASIAPAAFSPSYGIKVPCWSIELEVQVRLEHIDPVWEFAVRQADTAATGGS